MSRILTVILSICQIINLLIWQKENTAHLRKPISFIWKVRGKANDKYNLLFFQFSCRSNYTLAVFLRFISCQAHPSKKTGCTMQLIFYPVLRVTVWIYMAQYHFIFFSEPHFFNDPVLSELVHGSISFFHTDGCYDNEWISRLWNYQALCPSLSW